MMLLLATVIALGVSHAPDVPNSAPSIRIGKHDLAAYQTPAGNIVYRVRSDGRWGPPIGVTESSPRRQGEKWDLPRLALGPDGAVWLAYRSEVRRRLFLHRWLGEAWSPRMDGPAIQWVRPGPDAQFNQELRPLKDFILEGSRVRDAIELRLTSADEPGVVQIASVPMPHMAAAPGRGALFLDTMDVAETEGLVWQPELPRKHPNPVLSPNSDPDAPDAMRVFNRGTVRLENGRFRMWYAAVGTVTADDSRKPWQARMSVCYAESDDGIHWRRPELRQAEYRGSRRNNRLAEFVYLPIIVYDEREPDSERRYKCIDAGAVGDLSPEAGQLLTSSDGLCWRREPAPRRFPGARPWYIEFHSLFRDDEEPNPAWRWKAYGSFGTGPLRRASHLSTSPDGMHWTGYPENPIVDPLAGLGHGIHDLVVWREGGLYIGILQVADELFNFDWELVVSRDGVHFSRVADGLKFLGRGAPGAFDHGNVQASAPVRVDDQWFFYYGGSEKPFSRYPHVNEEVWNIRQHCGLARIGAGRYASFRAVRVSGRLTTQPVRVAFDRELDLLVNVAAVGSEVRVAVLDAETRQPLEGYSFDECRSVVSDGVRTPLHWLRRSSVVLRADRPVRLSFQMKGNARLYGFEWSVVERGKR